MILTVLALLVTDRHHLPGHCEEKPARQLTGSRHRKRPRSGVNDKAGVASPFKTASQRSEDPRPRLFEYRVIPELLKGTRRSSATSLAVTAYTQHCRGVGMPAHQPTPKRLPAINTGNSPGSRAMPPRSPGAAGRPSQACPQRAQNGQIWSSGTPANDTGTRTSSRRSARVSIHGRYRECRVR